MPLHCPWAWTKNLISVCGAQVTVFRPIVRKGERVRLRETEPLARCNEGQDECKGGEDKACDRQTGGWVRLHDGIGGTGTCADENEEDKEDVNLADRGRCKPLRTSMVGFKDAWAGEHGMTTQSVSTGV